MLAFALAAAAALPTLMDVPPVISVIAKCTENADRAEIVVCARSNDQRLKSITGPTESSMPRAETQIFKGVKADLVAESATLGAANSSRAMVRLKIAF